MTAPKTRPTVHEDRQPGRTAVFFGGVVPASGAEETMAEESGSTLARAGYALVHGGYNGLMGAAARGAARHGGRICAVTLAGKRTEWGASMRTSPRPST